MSIKKEPFRRYNLDKSADAFTVRLNEEEREIFDKCKLILQQEKDSTAIKQLALEIGSKVIHDEKLKGFLSVVMNNYRKNKRLGVVTFD